MARKTERSGLYNGSAAYDIYGQNGLYYGGSAAPEVRPQGLPEEYVSPQRYRRVKAKTAVAPFAVLGLMVAVCMMVLVIFGYVQLYEATEHVSRLESQLSNLQEEQAVLESLYEGSIDMAEVEEMAAELGLTIPTREQTVYVNLAGSDRAELYTSERVGLVERVLRAFQSSAGGLVEYLS